MARIAGVDLPRDKHAWIALTYIYGIGRSRSMHIFEKTGIEPTIKANDRSFLTVLTRGESSSVKTTFIRKTTIPF